MVSATIELRGHIIDSLILPKVLDQILTRGATFKITEIKIGQNRADQSFARIEVGADSEEALNELMLRLRQHGAEMVEREDAQLAPAPADGVFPDEFYVTTNQQTFVRINGHEIEIQPAMMDSAIAVDTAKGIARALKFYEVKRGDQIVIGHQGIRVVPVQRSTSHTDLFQFINATIGADEPKAGAIREIADELEQARQDGGKIAAVAGKAVVLTGASEYLQRLIELGYINRFFTGNGFAVYDVERALFGTSGGVSVERLTPGAGRENHLRAINVLRALGGLQAAVKKKVLHSGIMHACIRKNVDIVLTGSIRDDGPIPGVTTDVVEAQKVMREKLADVTHVLLLGTVQHSLAIASMLSPSVKTICVDINPAAVDLIVDRQPFQSIGLVTDVEPFLRELCEAIDAAKSESGALRRKISPIMRELLLCPPDHYGIEYEINPWMSRARGAEAAVAQQQWKGLYDTLTRLEARIHLVEPQPKLPDMVFTANAGLAVGKKFIPSNFRHQERAGEAPHFVRWMEKYGYDTLWLSDKLYFEGEGDALFGGEALFCGYKFRSDIQSHRAVADMLSCLVISVELVDPRFYHLDTCFCPLPDGSAFWFPEAFDEYGQRAIRDHVPNLIDVEQEEAAHFSCNAVVLERDIVLPEGAPRLVATLQERGYSCHALPMTEFLKAGGACKCLTMFLPQRITPESPWSNGVRE